MAVIQDKSFSYCRLILWSLTVDQQPSRKHSHVSQVTLFDLTARSVQCRHNSPTDCNCLVFANDSSVL